MNYDVLANTIRTWGFTCFIAENGEQKKRRTGFRGAELGVTSSALPSSQGGALGSNAPAVAEVVSGDRHPQGQASGEPAPPLDVAARRTGSHMIGTSGAP
eukprot:4879211-Amphidinium_carterae.1